MRHREHRLIDKLLLGREFRDVHVWMDEPYRWLGRKHRVLRHDPITLMIKYYDDPERLTSGLLHIIADRVGSKVKRRKNRF